MKRVLGGSGPTWEPDNILRIYRKVESGLIRVFADEVTYPLHVILRYKLEKAIIANDLRTDDLPGGWTGIYAARAACTCRMSSLNKPPDRPLIQPHSRPASPPAISLKVCRSANSD